MNRPTPPRVPIVHHHRMRAASAVPAASRNRISSEEETGRSRIFIVDDHQLFVAGLSSLINQAGDLEVCGAAHGADEVVREVRRLHPDLVILDVQLRDTDGLAVAEALRRVVGDIPLLFLSSLADPQHRRRAERLGALGFLEKTQKPDSILEGIHRALANRGFAGLRACRG